MVAWRMGVGVALLVADFFLGRAQSKLRLHGMPVAVGIYLRVGLSVPILPGGLVRYFVDRRDAPGTETKAHRGVLITSGLIAGESLAGELLGLLAYLGVQSMNVADQLLSGLPPALQDTARQWISLLVLLGVAAAVYRQSLRA